ERPQGSRGIRTVVRRARPHGHAAVFRGGPAAWLGARVPRPMVDHPLYKTAPAEVRKVLGRWLLTDGFSFIYDAERSHDAFIVDAITGDEYLDLFSFFASMPLGHNHPGMHDEDFLEIGRASCRERGEASGAGPSHAATTRQT